MVVREEVRIYELEIFSDGSYNIVMRAKGGSGEKKTREVGTGEEGGGGQGEGGGEENITGKIK